MMTPPTAAVLPPPPPDADVDMPPLEQPTDSDSEEPDPVSLRRSGRILKPTIVGLESAANPAWMMMATTVTTKQAAADPEWRAAMQREIKSLQDLGTFEVVSRPGDKKVITTRWVYQEKDAKQGKERYKARLVAQGFKQVYGLDYDETWAPTARASSIRLIVAMAMRDRSHLRLIDIKNAFLNAPLNKHQIYVEPPTGYASAGKVWLLRKALYGLKQAGKEWSDELNRTLAEIGFSRSKADPCVFFMKIERTLVIIAVHVDDCFIKYDTENQLATVMAGLLKRYKVSDMGEVSHALGIDFVRTADNKMFMSQRGYTESILERFGFATAHPAHTPAADGLAAGKLTGLEKHEMNTIVGALLWLSLNTRPPWLLWHRWFRSRLQSRMRWQLEFCDICEVLWIMLLVFRKMRDTLFWLMLTLTGLAILIVAVNQALFLCMQVDPLLGVPRSNRVLRYPPQRQRSWRPVPVFRMPFGLHLYYPSLVWLLLTLSQCSRTTRVLLHSQRLLSQAREPSTLTSDIRSSMMQ